MRKRKKKSNDSEERFSDVLANTLGGVVKPVTDKQILDKGVNVLWRLREGMRPIGIYVKTLKEAENDEQSAPDTAWLEVDKYDGNKGWLKGSASYIVFENPYDWLIIRKDQLRAAVENMIPDNRVTRDRTTYFRYYQADGSRGKSVRVPVSFLRKNACKIIIKRNFLDYIKKK